jgi:ligand-binding sensor domain-containing protein/two-component sensor histidine kinase
MLRAAILLCINMCITHLGIAQQHASDYFNTKHGLLNNRCGNISQDAYGYIWIGTDDGICNFDGFKFNSFLPDDRYYFAHSYATYYKDKVILGSSTKGIAICSKNNVQWVVNDSMKKLSIFTALKFNDNLYFVGFNRRNGAAWLYNNQLFKANIPDSIAKYASAYFQMVIDENKNAWVISEAGAYVYTNSYKNMLYPKELLYKYTNYICNFKDGSVLVSQNKTIWQLRVVNNQVICNKYKECDAEIVYMLYNSKQDELIINYVVKESERISLKTNNTKKIYVDKVGKTIWACTYDKENNLWLASENGIAKISNLSFGKVQFDNKVYNHPKSGTFIENGFLFGNSFEYYLHKNKELIKIIGLKDHIGFDWQKIAYTPDKQYFINANSQSVDFDVNTFQAYITNNTIVKGKSLKQAYNGPKKIEMNTWEQGSNGLCMFVDMGRQIWHYKNKKFALLKNSYNQVLLANRVIMDTVHNFVYTISINGYIHQYKNVQFGKMELADSIKIEKHKTTDYYQILKIDKKGNILVGTQAEGLFIFKKQNNFFNLKPIQLKNNELKCNAITSLCVLANNDIWVGTSQGISILKEKTDTSYTIINDVLMESLDGAYSFFIKNHNNTMYIGTTGGCAIVDSPYINVSYSQPIVLINHLSINNINADSLLSKGEFVLKPGNNSLSIELFSSSFINTSKNKFYYKLIGGATTDWQLINGNTISFNQLPAGNYTLQCKTTTPLNTESQASSLLTFTILAPFYKRWWFILSCVALLSYILYKMYNYRIQQALKLQNTRNKISKDLHDDIGTSLSSITMMNQLLQIKINKNKDDAISLSKKIEEQSRELIQNMNDIVWSINANNDTLELLITRLNQYAGTIFEANNVSYSITSINTENKVIKSIEIKRELYLMAKEIMTNAAKYAKANNFSLLIQVKNNNLVLTAIDDGIGIQTNNNKLGGNGIANIYKRAQALGGNAQVQTSNNAGTTWLINIPLK